MRDRQPPAPCRILLADKASSDPEIRWMEIFSPAGDGRSEWRASAASLGAKKGSNSTGIPWRCSERATPSYARAAPNSTGRYFEYAAIKFAERDFPRSSC